MSLGKKFLFSGFFENLYYFFAMHIYVILSILGVALSMAVLLFIAELLFPKVVHVFNYSLTDKVFYELVEEYRYQAAISFMEMKPEVLEKSNDSGEYLMKLADCYIGIGDYPKALSQYQILRNIMAKEMGKENIPEDMSKEVFQAVFAMIDASLAKEEFRVYLKMGDKPNIIKMANKLRALQQKTNWEFVEKALASTGEDIPGFVDADALRDGYNLEIIQGEFIENPQKGLADMENYTQKVLGNMGYGFPWKLRLLNNTIRMSIETGQTVKARRYLEKALSLLDLFQYHSLMFEPLGELSEYCYDLHDKANGKRLLKKHLSLIDDIYAENSIEYLSAHAKELKYLQEDGDWDALEERADEISEALRGQISDNFAGMTTSQREYFVSQFQPIFDYVNAAVELHPSESLLTTAFENNMFRQGLLLRSQTSLANAINAINDPDVTSKYNAFVRLSKERITRSYISGPGNTFRVRQINDSIANLEKEIAAKSVDFRRVNESTSTIKDVRKSLSNSEVAMQVIEGQKSYYALLLDENGHISYHPIGNKDAIKSAVSQGGSFYTDTELANNMFGNLQASIQNKTVYYTPSGLFSQVILPTIRLSSDGTTMGDIAQMRLVSSPMAINELKDKGRLFNLSSQTAYLWGGVNYGPDSLLVVETDSLRGIERGSDLKYLPGSMKEVQRVGQLIASNGGKAYIYSGDKATEKSFVNRDGKQDYLLHISTHGFFHDDKAFENPIDRKSVV